MIEAIYFVQVFDREHEKWISVNYGRSQYARLAWATKRASKLATHKLNDRFRVADAKDNEIWLAERQLRLAVE